MTKREDAILDVAEHMAKFTMKREMERVVGVFDFMAQCPTELCTFGDDGQCRSWRFHEHALTNAAAIRKAHGL